MNYLNSKGLICGPNETLEEFHNRCEFFKKIKKEPQLLKNILRVPDVIEQSMLEYDDLDLVIDWVFMNPSRKGLAIWEAAATWTIELDQVSIPLLQTKSRSKILQEDILKHEAVHIARVSFKEPIYEEFLAYATSKSAWRRLFGPLFHSSKESLLFVILSFCPFLSILFPISIHILFFPFFVFSLILLLKLFYYYKVFTKALIKITTIFDVESALKVALRFSDKEIHLFAFSSSEELYRYINEQICTRWKQILSSYPLK